MPIISPLVKPKFVVGLTSKSLTYKDTTNWASLSSSQIANMLSFLAILKIAGPNGVFYANSGYPSNSFASPDINVKLTDEKTGIPFVPVDSNGDILNGQYSFYAKYKINVQNLAIADTGTNTITLTNSGDYATFLTNVRDTPGAVVTIVGGANAGTYTIASATSGFGGTVVVLNQTLPSSVVTGSSLWVTLPEAINSIDFCYEIPTPVVEITSNCLQSKLVCKDATDYGSAGITLVSRENRVKYPLTMETPVADIVDTTLSVNQQLTVNPIYTHTWAGIITTNFIADKTTYQLDITIKGMQEHDVDCDIRLCGAFECIKTMVDQYNSYLGTNPTAATKLQSILFKIQDAFMLYSIAIECGNDQEACNQVDIIIDLIGSTGCNCGCNGTDDSGFATLVLAVGNAEGGSMPLNYLETDNITVNSNARVPSNTAVINYLAQELNNYYTETQIDALIANYYTKTQIDTIFQDYYTETEVDTILEDYYTETEADSNFVHQYENNAPSGSSTNDNLSGYILLNATNAPVLAGDIGLFVFNNNLVTPDSLVIVQIKDQSGIAPLFYTLIDVVAGSGTVSFRCNLSGLIGAVDDNIEIQFLVCNT